MTNKEVTKEYKDLLPELVEALEKIGNRIGSPVMGYAPTVALKEYEEMRQEISLTVQQALTKAKKTSALVQTNENKL